MANAFLLKFIYTNLADRYQLYSDGLPAHSVYLVLKQ